MLKLLCEALIGPLLVGGSTLIARRWGAAIGGVVSGFPAVVGPVLLIVAEAHGAGAAADAARGTLLGLVALSGFILAYARLAKRASWPASALGAWLAAAALSVLLARWGKELGLAAGLGAAALSLTLSYLLPPPTDRRDVALAAGPVPSARRSDLLLRMVATAALVIVLSAAVGLVGALVGGVLAALPVLASVLAVCTHRAQGALAAVALLRGLVIGMASFVAFCLAIALLAPAAGIAAGFTAATVAAVAVQAATLHPRIGRGATTPRSPRAVAGLSRPATSPGEGLP